MDITTSEVVEVIIEVVCGTVALAMISFPYVITHVIPLLERFI